MLYKYFIVESLLTPNTYWSNIENAFVCFNKRTRFISEERAITEMQKMQSVEDFKISPVYTNTP